MQQANEEIRYFSGPSMRSVLAEVRATFGKDALIHSQEQDHGRVRVAASGMPATRPSLVEAAQDAVPAPRQQQIETTDETNSIDTAQVLRPLGFDEDFLSRLPRSVRSLGDLGRGIAKELKLESVLPATGCFRFVGGPGTGKSSLVVNWAALHRRNHPSIPIHLVSTDCARLGGSAMLDRAGELLDIKVLHADATRLDETLQALPKEGLVLVDTRSDETLWYAAATNVLVAAVPYASGLPEDAQLESAGAIVLTHTDRARSFGRAFSDVARSKLTLLALGVSRDVPGGISRCSSDQLAEMALRGIEEF